MGSPALSVKWQTACLVTKTPSYLRGDAPVLMHLLESFSPLSSLSTCVFSFSSLWNWLWPSSLCWCCSDRKTHPPSAALSLTHSLTLIGCLLEVTSPFFSACLPPSSSVPSLSLSLSLPHSQRTLAIPLLYPPLPVLYFLCPLLPPYINSELSAVHITALIFSHVL